jgi:hydroxymethylpyrimidine/phosphomethylpyrimidine kinase
LPETREAILCIAGLDPSGGAGLLRDTAVVRDHGMHPLGALTGVAVQNTTRFDRRALLEPADLVAQLDTLLEEFQPAAVKIGMIGSTPLVEALASWLEGRPRLPVVLDPVLRSTSGGALGENGLLPALSRRLFPRVHVLTPNLDEAGAFVGREVETREDVPYAARELRDLGADWVLVKGGHLRKSEPADYLLGPGGERWIEGERVEGDARGTGCALATALACGLARGDTVPEAARAAKRYVAEGLRSAYRAGKGSFPG